MARKTFGRAGQSITIPDSDPGENRDTVRIFQPTTSDVDGRSDGHVADAGRDLGEPDLGSDTDETGESSSETGDESTGIEGNATATFVNPAAATEQPRRRGPKPGSGRGGRPKGSKNKPSEDAQHTAVLQGNLEKALLAIHKIGSGMLACPELQLDLDEASVLAESLKNVAVTYEWGKVVDPKVTCLIDLAATLGIVYGDRIPVIYARLTRKRPPGTVDGGKVQVMR